MKIAIFSDLHLKNPQSPEGDKFLEVLRELRTKKKIKELWLLGDIFDLLVGPFAFWRKMHAEIFQELKTLSESGSKILWLEGNHDFHFLELANLFGIDVLDGPQSRIVGGKRVLLAHGDLVNTEDKAYLRWRATTRSTLFRRAISMIPESFAEEKMLKLAEKVSAKSRHYSASHDRDLKTLYRKYADDSFKQGFDAVMLGHCHEFDLYKNQNAFYLNLGTWLGGEKRYALWEPKKMESPEICVIR